MATPAAGRRSLSWDIAVTGATNVGIVGLNFGTGVLVARLLGPSGRGEAAVILTLAQIVGWLGSLGMNEGVTYVGAKRPHDMGRIVGTSLVLVVGLGTVGLALALGLLPVVIGADDPSLAIGRMFMVTIYLGVANGLFSCTLAGNQDFAGANLVRVAQPATYLVLLLAFLAFGQITVGTVLVAAGGGLAATVVASLARLWRTVGVGKPSLDIAKQVGSYGLRVQGSLLGDLGTARLDFLLLPTFLTPAAIGLYSVATNVSSIIVSVVGAVGQLAFPAAARRGQKDGTVLVGRLLRLLLSAGTLVAIPLFVLAPWAISLVYGEAFRGAATPLRILLPGVVFSMGSTIVAGGLQAVNRPLAASACQLAGLVTTVVGLLLTLRPLGINGAALTTTCAYAVILLMGMWLLRTEEHFSWRDALSPSGVVSDVRSLVAHARYARSRRPEEAAEPDDEVDGAG